VTSEDQKQPGTPDEPTQEPQKTGKTVSFAASLTQRAHMVPEPTQAEKSIREDLSRVMEGLKKSPTFGHPIPVDDPEADLARMAELDAEDEKLMEEEEVEIQKMLAESESMYRGVVFPLEELTITGKAPSMAGACNDAKQALTHASTLLKSNIEPAQRAAASICDYLGNSVISTALANELSWTIDETAKWQSDMQACVFNITVKSEYDIANIVVQGWR